MATFVKTRSPTLRTYRSVGLSCAVEFFARYLFCVALYYSLSPVQAQKVEQEYSLDASEFPAFAKTYLNDNFPNRRRTRYYRDEGQRDTTIEAKFKAQQAWYSVEFTPAGDWLNTEVEVSVGDVPESIWTEVCGTWSDRYGKFRIARVQEHVGADSSRYYEVEIRGRKDFEWDRYEAAIDYQGKVLSFDTIRVAPGHLDRW